MTTYRPQFLWLLTGPLVGAVCGSVAATALLMDDVLGRDEEPGAAYVVADALDALVLGTTFGGFFGAVAGFFAGLPLIFLVGRHLARPVARRRAFFWGVLSSPFAMIAMCVVVTRDASLLVGWLSAGGWGLAAVVGISVLGGALAGWVAGMGGQRKTVS